MDEQRVEVFGRPGRMRWFNASETLGFIEPVDAAYEMEGLEPTVREGAIFVHASVMQSARLRSLRDGQAVRFDAVRTSRGWKATRVERVDGDGPGDAGVGAVPKRPPGLL